MQERGYQYIRIVPDKLGLSDINRQILFDDAKKLAQELELDLICINEEKLIFTISNKEKLDYYNKKHKPVQKRKEVKTVKIKGSIGEHDLERKEAEIEKFKSQGHQVKLEVYIHPRYMNELIIKKILSLFHRLEERYKIATPKIEQRITVNI